MFESIQFINNGEVSYSVNNENLEFLNMVYTNNGENEKITIERLMPVSDDKVKIIPKYVTEGTVVNYLVDNKIMASITVKDSDSCVYSIRRSNASSQLIESYIILRTI